MAIISEQSYIADGNQRAFQVVGNILSDSHVGVWLVDYTTTPEIETRIPTADYDVLGSVILFNEPPANGLTVSLLLTDNGEGIEQPPSTWTDISTNIQTINKVGDNIDSINLVSGNESNINTVSTNILDVNTVASNIVNTNKVGDISTDVTTVADISTDVTTVANQNSNITSIVNDVIPNMPEILQADDNANIATTKASEAQLSFWEAEARKMTADSYATEPEDVFVKIYTSNGDGTFTATDTTEYSSLHWATKAGGLSTLADIVADSVKFTGGTGTQGTVNWNNDEETLDLVQNGAVLQLGQELQVHCRNNTATTIKNGTPVMVTGTLGLSGRVTIAPAITNDAKLVLGIATYDIGAGEDGKITVFGKVRGVDTSLYAEEDILYLDSTNGTLTNVKPADNDLNMPIAIVINSSATVGTLQVRVNGLDENAFKVWTNTNVGTISDFEGALI